MSDPEVTKILRKLSTTKELSEDEWTSIYNAFFAEVRKAALREIGQALSSKVSATTLAETALREALKYARETEQLDRERFTRLVRQIVKRRLIDRLRKHTTQKSDMRKETHSDEGDFVSDLPPVESVAELSELRSAIVHSVLYGQARERDRLIGILGLLAEFSTSQIAEAVAPLNKNQKKPSNSLVQVTIRNCRMNALNHLRSLGLLEEEEDEETS